MDEVTRYYDECVQQEWERLEHCRMEYAVTMRIFADYLPPSPATILDLGGGPGRYAIALTRLGYEVTLADISAIELESAQKKAREAGISLARAVQVGGLDLDGFADETFHTVLMMGPLYHLLHLEERQRLVREAWRVLKPGRRLFATFINRYSAFREEIKHRPWAIMELMDEYRQVLATGEITGPRATEGFTEAYVSLPEEVRPLMEGCGFETLALVGVEGVSGEVDEEVNQLEGEAWERWVELNYEIGQYPSALGISDHLLYVGKKRESLALSPNGSGLPKAEQSR